jgi:SAM-dependent methyltransferase
VEWYGFDLADDCVKEATRRSSAFYRTMDMSIRQGDFTLLSLETAKSATSLRFDIIVCMLALHYHPRPADWFQVVAASLKPHGVVVIYILNRDQLVQAWKASKSSVASVSATASGSPSKGPQSGDQWSNSVASISWTGPTMIRYTLGTRVQGLEENSWTPDEYIKWAAGAGLACIESRPAVKWGSSSASASAVPQVSHLPRDQQHVFEFHHGLVFRKTTT